MQKISSKKAIMTMYMFAAVVYFTSYVTRTDYNTVLVEISSAENISRTLLSLPLTASFVTYGLGQIISGYLGDRFDPFKIVSIGLLLSAAMNILVPLVPNPYLMIIFWGINGFAQALIYPPLMKITSTYLESDNYGTACLFISVGSHIATLFLYILSPVLIMIAGWKLVFFATFGFSILFLVAWQFYARHIKSAYKAPIVVKEEADVPYEKQNESVDIKHIVFASGLVFVMLAIIMQGFLRDGIATWMPAFLSDTFSLSNEVSIFTTIILPVFSILSSYLILRIRTHICRDEIKLSAIVFLVGAVSTLLLILFKNNMALSVVFLALTSACAHSINFLLICLVPKRFESVGKFSFITGLLNSCTYVGAALSSYGFAAISDSFGWRFTFVVWIFIAAVGAGLCAFAIWKWKKFSFDNK